MSGKGSVDYSKPRKLSSGESVYQYINPNGEEGGWVTKNVKILGDTYINFHSNIVCGSKDSLQLINTKVGPGCNIFLKGVNTIIESCSISGSDFRNTETNLSWGRSDPSCLLKFEDCRVHASSMVLPKRFKFHHYKKLRMDNNSLFIVSYNLTAKVSDTELVEGSTFIGDRLLDSLFMSKVYLSEESNLVIRDARSVMVRDCNLIDHDREDKRGDGVVKIETFILRDLNMTGGKNNFVHKKSNIITN